jgi:hypothetical protein
MMPVNQYVEIRNGGYYSRQHPEGAVVTSLRTENPDIDIPLESAFDLDA